jgi:hypothetical protein
MLLGAQLVLGEITAGLKKNNLATPMEVFPVLNILFCILLNSQNASGA